MNFHKKLDEFYDFISKKTLSPPFQRSDLEYYHLIRNTFYHEGKNIVPSVRDLEGVEEAAEWMFKKMFDIDLDAEISLYSEIKVNITDAKVELAVKQPIKIDHISSTDLGNDDFSVELFIVPRRDDVNLVNITTNPEICIIINDNNGNLFLGKEIKGDNKQVIVLTGKFEKGKEYEFDLEFFCVNMKFHEKHIFKI